MLSNQNVDNYAGHFEFGDGEEVLGIFAHMDVGSPLVAVGTQIPTHQLSKMVAFLWRGALDDKGPTTALLLRFEKSLKNWVFQLLKYASSLEQMKNQGWADMDYYFGGNVVDLVKPDFGFSPVR